MKKINNKGYVLIELIVASIIAFGIGYYLLNLTYEFANKNENLYLSNKMLTYKGIITKTIMKDIEDKNITSISKSGNIITITGNNNFKRNIVFTETSIEYKDDSNNLIYKKNFEDNIKINNYSYTNNTIKIELSNIYIKDIYTIKIII